MTKGGDLEKQQNIFQTIIMILPAESNCLVQRLIVEQECTAMCQFSITAPKGLYEVKWSLFSIIQGGNTIMFWMNLVLWLKHHNRKYIPLFKNHISHSLKLLNCFKKSYCLLLKTLAVSTEVVTSGQGGKIIKMLLILFCSDGKPNHMITLCGLLLVFQTVVNKLSGKQITVNH